MFPWRWTGYQTYAILCIYCSHKPPLYAANLSQGNKDHTATAFDAVTLADSSSVSDAIHATAQPAGRPTSARSLTISSNLLAPHAPRTLPDFCAQSWLGRRSSPTGFLSSTGAVTYCRPQSVVANVTTSPTRSRNGSQSSLLGISKFPQRLVLVGTMTLHQPACWLRQLDPSWKMAI